MKRIISLLGLTVLVVAVLAVSALPALAAPKAGKGCKGLLNAIATKTSSKKVVNRKRVAFWKATLA